MKVREDKEDKVNDGAVRAADQRQSVSCSVP